VLSWLSTTTTTPGLAGRWQWRGSIEHAPPAHKSLTSADVPTGCGKTLLPDLAELL